MKFQMQWENTMSCQNVEPKTANGKTLCIEKMLKGNILILYIINI